MRSRATEVGPIDRPFAMNWLFKEEPTHYSYDELVKDSKTSGPA